jgi:hypothetical protein
MPWRSSPVTDREEQRRLLADDHDELPSMGQRRVQERPTQHGSMAGHQRDHDGAELGTLRLVHRDGVGVREVEQARVRVAHLAPVVEAQQLLLGRVERLDRPEVAVEHAQVVVIAELEHAIARPVQPPTAPRLSPPKRGISFALTRRALWAILAARMTMSAVMPPVPPPPRVGHKRAPVRTGPPVTS